MFINCLLRFSVMAEEVASASSEGIKSLKARSNTVLSSVDDS